MGCGPAKVKNPSFLMLGFPGAGKSEILNYLKGDEEIKVFQTKGFSTEMLNCNGYDVCVWDLGGPEKCRPLWRHYFENAKALIFVVDASNTELLPKLKSEISQILREQALSKNLPVLILSNKHEAENALTIDDLTQGLDVRSIKQNTQIVEISAKTGDGIIDSIKWLRSSIKSK